MPLIRYRIGDLVERHERPYHTSYVVHGRAADAFHTAADRRVTTWQIDQCFTDLPGVAHYQLCQRVEGEWMLRFVPDNAPPAPTEIEELRRRLAHVLAAQTQPAIQQTDLLVPESSGKFRLGYPARKPA
jgi:phenylacetate-coenzyme A ligase PaaK-like adenylate-forming protein